MKVALVDSEPAVKTLLDELENLPTQPPSLYLDIEGVKLSRHGSVSIVQIFVPPKNHVFLVNVFVLKEAAFRTTNHSGTDLRSILESSDVPKVFFDVRNDSDALFSHFQISLAGVRDVQLLEVAARSFSRERVAGLAKCIEKDAQLTPEAQALWKATKQIGLSLFDPRHGGSYDVFQSRPMLQVFIDYCTQDVVYLPDLWNIYTRKISTKWIRKVQHETCERVLESQKASYEPQGKDKGLSPWANPAKSGRGDGPSNTGARGPERKTMTAIAQLAATETAKKATATQPDAKPQPQRSVGQEGLGQSARSSALEAAQKVPKVTIPRGGTPFSKLDLPVRSKKEPEAGSHKKKTDPSTDPAIDPSKWKCTTCDREMQDSQKEDHLAGKQHIACVKRHATSQVGTLEQQQRIAAKAVIQSEDQPTPKPPPRKQQHRQKKAKAPGANGRTKPAAAAVRAAPQPQPHRQPLGLPYPPGHLFIGFSGQRPAAAAFSSYGYGGVAPDYGHGYGDGDGYGGGDYGLCDRDCGWCGRCMDGR